MVKRIVVQIVICLFLNLPSPRAFGPQSTLQTRIQVSYESAMPKDVFKQLAQSLKCELVINERVTNRISVFARNVTLQTVFDAICEDIGCNWRIEYDKLMIEPSSKDDPSGLFSHSVLVTGGLDSGLPSSMRFDKVPLQKALQDLFKSARVGYVLFGKLFSNKTPVTIDVSNERIVDGLKKVIGDAGIERFEIRQTLDNPPSYFIVVSPTGER